MGVVVAPIRSAYDPLDDLLVAQESKPTSLKAVNLRALDPYQRALLTIDGTVTKFIEAYTMEPVVIAGLEEETQLLPSHHPWLDAPEKTRVVARQVTLEGKHSRVFHAYAASLTVPDRLGEKIKRELKVNEAGIGRAIRKIGLETRREVLWYGSEGPDQVPEAVRGHFAEGCLTRTYRIIAHGKPVMLICEKFPMYRDRQPSHH